MTRELETYEDEIVKVWRGFVERADTSALLVALQRYGYMAEGPEWSEFTRGMARRVCGIITQELRVRQVTTDRALTTPGPRITEGGRLG